MLANINQSTNPPFDTSRTMTSTNAANAHITGETRPLKILVVGAGIGGLAAAIALRRQGHGVEVQGPRVQDTMHH
jgi:pyruvate/2-oxoglutarate dehydrogenase complex dihydrolipoamide dehydrogenase (E3) component